MYVFSIYCVHLHVFDKTYNYVLKNSGFVIAILRKIKRSLQKIIFNTFFRILFIYTYFTMFIRFFYNNFAAYLARKSYAQ